MKTDNELIAEFHGWVHVPTPKGKGKGLWNFPAWGRSAFCSDSFQYHTSWDWLMPVVQKFLTLYAHSDHTKEWCAHSFRIRNRLSTADIDDVYGSIVEFIKWYNNQNL